MDADIEFRLGYLQPYGCRAAHHKSKRIPSCPRFRDRRVQCDTDRRVEDACRENVRRADGCKRTDDRRALRIVGRRIDLPRLRGRKVEQCASKCIVVDPRVGVAKFAKLEVRTGVVVDAINTRQSRAEIEIAPSLGTRRRCPCTGAKRTRREFESATELRVNIVPSRESRRFHNIDGSIAVCRCWRQAIRARCNSSGILDEALASTANADVNLIRKWLWKRRDRTAGGNVFEHADCCVEPLILHRLRTRRELADRYIKVPIDDAFLWRPILTSGTPMVKVPYARWKAEHWQHAERREAFSQCEV